MDTITLPRTAGRQLTPEERRARNERIADARDAGATWLEIALRFEISSRHARRAYKEHQDTIKTAFEIVRRAVEHRGVPGNGGTAA